MPGVEGSVELARPGPRLSAQIRRTPPRKPARASALEAAEEEEGAALTQGKASLCHPQQPPRPVGICKDNLVVSFIFSSQIAYYYTHLLVVPAPGGGGEGEGTIPTVGPPGPAPP